MKFKQNKMKVFKKILLIILSQILLVLFHQKFFFSKLYPLVTVYIVNHNYVVFIEDSIKVFLIKLLKT